MRYVTYILLLIMVVIYFSPANFYDTSNELVNYSLRTYYHANIEHLIANSISLYYLSFLEDLLGHTQFAIAIIFIWLVSSMILYIIHAIMPSRKVYTVGFSGVIFGLIVIYYFSLNQNPGITMTGLIISILPQLVVPGISFEGHLSGIIAGVIYVTLFPVKKLN
ncbi:Integral membrane [Acanthamoeba polyphaga mimivirus]|uniref:Integral membrane n=5 Tax=Megamimivirinae TaxID=3044648 RepID=A0A2L2DJN0_MIMIV|nr:putative rhomboid protein [Megavirus chiliensis]AEQ32833.1 putative rhomboid protein [Megavirus chiliensis]AFX92727.1 putative rhomboid protein [Megavirus courdo11]AGD92585.1 putative rhomboid protein [Megavirus lba]AVG46365.1 Integral membrane [Acanthamoeba polyphaga mimivirus]